MDFRGRALSGYSPVQRGACAALGPVSQNTPIQKPLRLRRLYTADSPFADSVRARCGWNQTLADWERFLETEPEGCFLAEWDGTAAGTATTTLYGPDLAWIGMVLVHPDFRRRGIGSALLQHCIQYLRGRSVRCIKLDATPAGKMVYDGLGFHDEWTLRRWEGRPATIEPESGLRLWQASDADRIDLLDRKAFGASRRKLLGALASQSHTSLVAESALGGIEGFGFARAGSRAVYLGPVVAANPEKGLRLVSALLAHHPGQKVFWDIPDDNKAAVTWAQQHGLTEQRPLIRMFLGENASPGDPRLQFALAGPEVG